MWIIIFLTKYNSGSPQSGHIMIVFYSGLSYSINTMENFGFRRQAPKSGFRGFWVCRFQILMEASSPSTGKASKWPISNMAARFSTDFKKYHF